ncbi:MAG: multidrug effflux MFS transporter [Desulfobacteraceae bacterium]|nr:multidrug effflux MFS transporter [Desulfobacteraceae bacterium]MBC2753182.1 multidrug effflux MFS transporter [Desulfobacteraceae bacterium]
MNKTRMLFLLALLSAFPPLSTDMYLPAIPLLVKLWQQPLALVNLTLVGFFISYCVFLLFYGPLSDRFGRRPLLLAGIGLFILASLLCALADGVVSMITFRVLQAAGAASASTLALAISKDIYDGHERERILAYIGVIMALAPMLAPVFGGWILTWFSWRWVFVSQATIATVAWIGVWRMPETLVTPSSKGALQTAGIYLGLFRNRRYVGYALMLSIIVLPHFAFIGGSADIYITRIGLSEQTFGYLFALNAAAIMAGSLACSWLLGRIGSRGVMTAGFTGILCGGLVMLTGWLPAPWGLALPMAMISFSFGLSRPPSNNLVLEQVDRHAGAASSLLVFIYFMLGAFSMWLISLDWLDKIYMIGILGTGAGGIMLGVWMLLPFIERRKPAVIG